MSDYVRHVDGLGPKPAILEASTQPSIADYAYPAINTRGRGHTPTRSTRIGVNGLWDMGGNVWEWTDNGGQGVDIARPTRGGSWWYGSAQMHSNHLQTKPANTSAVYIGFRCAKSLQ